MLAFKFRYSIKEPVLSKIRTISQALVPVIVSSSNEMAGYPLVGIVSMALVKKLTG